MAIVCVAPSVHSMGLTLLPNNELLPRNLLWGLMRMYLKQWHAAIEKRHKQQVSSSYLSGLTLEQLFDHKAVYPPQSRPLPARDEDPRTPVKTPRGALSSDCGPAWILCTTIALQTCSLCPLCALHSNVYSLQSKVEYGPVGDIRYESLLWMDLSNLQI